MKKRGFLILFLSLNAFLFAQEGENPLPYVEKEKVYDIPPAFPGGEKALSKYFQDSIRYPPEEFKKRKEGSVSMKFTVTKKGKLKHVEAINGVPGAPNFVKESVRLLNSMPPWIPAKKAGKPVQAEYYLHIPFRLENSKPEERK